MVRGESAKLKHASNQFDSDTDLHYIGVAQW